MRGVIKPAEEKPCASQPHHSHCQTHSNFACFGDVGFPISLNTGCSIFDSGKSIYPGHVQFYSSRGKKSISFSREAVISARTMVVAARVTGALAALPELQGLLELLPYLGFDSLLFPRIIGELFNVVHSKKLVFLPIWTNGTIYPVNG